MKEKLKLVNKILKRRLKFIRQPVRDYVLNSNFRQRVKYTKFFKKSKIKNNVILYESYHGKNMTGNPFAIFKGILKEPEFRNFQHVWAMEDEKNILPIYRNYKNVTFVIIHSDEYLKYLTEAKYLINNTSFPYYFQKKHGQVYVNTWHGTPLKTLGMDIKDAGLTDHKNIQRNLLHTDYLISPNRFTYEKLLKSHDIFTLYNGKIADIGYPRVDSMFLANKSKIKKLLAIPSDKKVILYAPTWRGKVNQELDMSSKLDKDLRELKGRLGKEYIILLKTHYFAYRFFENSEMANICIPESMDTNELLSIVDLLITDYSSIFFDFLPTNNPIIFYGDDYEFYEKDRGFYLNINELPGPFCKTLHEVIETIQQVDKVIEQYKSKYVEFFEKYCYHDDGNATNRFIDIVIREKESNLVFRNGNEKKKILFYCGGFYNNGITMSAINLMNSLDYSKYEIVVIESSDTHEGKEENIKKLHPNVSVLYRVGQWNMTIKEWYTHQLIMRRGLYSKRMKRNVPITMYKRELSRLLGNVNFDIVIDFGGYNAFWALLFAFGTDKKKCIYLHNIMMKEYEKIVNGDFKHRKNLKIIFSLYQYYNKIISVSESANSENYKDLHPYIDKAKEKMVYVNNIINYQNVLKKKDQKKLINYDNHDFLVLSGENAESGVLDVKGVDIPKEEHINFINIARLSPEKDQETLIYAFANVQKIESKARLYIVGEGTLEQELKHLVNSLGIEKNVYFTGQIENPYVLLNECDCFILSSEYEGQGLVLLESLILEKPVIGTNVPGIKSVLAGGYGTLVEHDREALQQAMISFISKGIEQKKFDYVAYNQEAMEMFFQEVCE
ncbi:glycosyltransferase [Heyndrickxia vini]|uniref:CDP-glycerol glycerophosphotransferase family protein n=1 Tax=Heyndrickxia vini TaxID=1476025 RepID=A0ABX7E6C8_9BACI|nr:glycosyltransferase [Heyndrickxia vini]QQZ10347.1 CDP-glycerol glycerophosphotransferase family protein [Heyndrickxia vini]